VASPAAKPSPPVVAELGRPETADETAARKADASKRYRASKTMNNLWFSLLVTVGVVLVIVFMVPRNDSPRTQSVDYVAAATEAQESFPVPLAVPELSKDWSSNGAEDRSSSLDKVSAWYMGFISPAQQYISLTQAVGANPSWLDDQLDHTRPSGQVSIDGIDWTVYDNRDASTDVGNVKYALTTESGASTFVIAGTATPDETADFASSISQAVKDQPETAKETTP
jgi:hypothetical protein